MNTRELAAIINGREYGSEITKEEAAAAKDAGLVVVYGYSDDNVELAGAIHDEINAWGGAALYLNSNGLLTNDCGDEDCPYFVRKRAGATKIEAFWSDSDDEFPWTFETSIPHESFEIFDDGEKYCRGIVFALSDVQTGKFVAPGSDSWISVTDCVPPIGGDRYYTDHSFPVLVANGSKTSETTWIYSHSEGGWLWASLSEGCQSDDYLDLGGSEITHWQPLPEPPEKEQP